MLEELILTFCMWTSTPIEYVLTHFDIETFDRAYFLAETARTRQELLQMQIFAQASRGTEESYKKFVKERLKAVGLSDGRAAQETNDLERLFHKFGGGF